MVIDHPSPNHGPRPDGAVVDTVVLHYTGMRDGLAALERLCDPVAAVSSHYLIDEDGRIFRLVADERRAWHAGVSSWQGAGDINDRSLGIELVNPGHEHGYRDFPDPQIAALEALLGDLLARHRVPPRRVLGHSDVAPARKEDPGERFPWPRLARAGLAVMPDAAPPASPDPAAARRLLAEAGYPAADGALALDTLVTAFQRRFRPARVDGRIDAETMGLIRAARDLLAPSRPAPSRPPPA